MKYLIAALLLTGCVADHYQEVRPEELRFSIGENVLVVNGKYTTCKGFVSHIPAFKDDRRGVMYTLSGLTCNGHNLGTVHGFEASQLVSKDRR